MLHLHNAAYLVLVALAAMLHGGAASTAARNPFLPPGREDIGWPYVRGPNYDGHSNEVHLAERWPPEGPPVLWTRTLGQGYSAWVAWDHRVATQYQTLAGQYVICLDADSGETIWRHRYGFPYEVAGVYPGPRATPTYADGCLYFASPRGLIGCLDARTGTRRWSVNIREQFAGRGTDFGYSCSPTVVDGKVILPAGGHGASVVALDARNGSVVWKAGDDAASYTPAYPVTFRGRQLVLGYLQNALVCHDLATGERVWRHVLSSGYDEHAAWPLYREPYVWLSGPFQAGSQLLQLTDDPAQPVKLVRISRVMSNDVCSSVLHRGAVYGFDLREAQAKAHRPSRGQFRCLDLLTGDIHWSTGSNRLRRDTAPSAADAGKRIGQASVIVADGKLILLNDTGELILARATTERYDELGRISVLGGEICWTQPALHRGRLFVRNQSRAACVYIGEPELLDPRARVDAVTAAEIPQARYVDVASLILGVEPEYAFDIPDTKSLWRWFVVTLVGVMGGSLVLVAAVSKLSGCGLASLHMRWLYRGLVFSLGVLGTTLLSRGFEAFIFTWPVALFISFEAVVGEMSLRATDETPAAKWRARAAILGFAVVCLTYFLVCRRLSLVFEWVFLCGFTAALPFSIAGRFWFRDRRLTWLWQAATTAAAYSAFYWSAVAILWLKGG